MTRVLEHCLLSQSTSQTHHIPSILHQYRFGITSLLRRCNSGINSVSHQYLIGSASVSRRYTIGITRISPRFHNAIASTAHRYHTGITTVSQTYHNHTISQRYHTNITSVSHRQHIGITSLSHRYHIRITAHYLVYNTYFKVPCTAPHSMYYVHNLFISFERLADGAKPFCKPHKGLYRSRPFLFIEIILDPS